VSKKIKNNFLNETHVKSIILYIFSRN